jgi:hypothetical protein
VDDVFGQRFPDRSGSETIAVEAVLHVFLSA